MVVLFLQNLRLKAGGAVVLEGVIVGLVFTAMVAAITFIAHHKLPYLKMLIVTGVMLVLAAFKKVPIMAMMDPGASAAIATGTSKFYRS